VVISWEKPLGKHSNNITSYEVLFVTKENRLAQLKPYCDGADPLIFNRRACIIPMNKIRHLTGLEIGQLISV